MGEKIYSAWHQKCYLQKMNAIQIVATNVEKIFTSLPLQYFGFEYAGCKTCSKSPVTKCSMILFLCHLQNYSLFT